jgi:hypothetical protein
VKPVDSFHSAPLHKIGLRSTKVGSQMVFFYIAWRDMSSATPVTFVIRNAQNLPEVQLARTLFTRPSGTEVFGQG